MYVSTRKSKRRLGTISTMVNGSLVLGSSPVRSRPIATLPIRIVGPTRPSPISPVTMPITSSPTVPTTPWGGNPPIAFPGGGSSPWSVSSGSGSSVLSRSGRQSRGGGWSGSGSGYGGGGSSKWGQQNYGSQNSQYGGLTYSQLQNLAQTDPAALTPTQYQAAQQAGLIAGTVPYSEAAAITTPPTSVDDPECLALGMTGGPYPNCTPAATTATTSTDIGTALTTDYAGLPLIAWLLIGGGVVLFATRGKR